MGVSGVRSSWLTCAIHPSLSSWSFLRSVSSRATTAYPPSDRGDQLHVSQRSSPPDPSRRTSATSEWPLRPGSAWPCRGRPSSPIGRNTAPTGWPMASASGTPRMRAIAGFQERTARSRPTVKIPSDDDSRTSARVRRSDCTSVKSDTRWSVDDTRWASASSMLSCCAV